MIKTKNIILFEKILKQKTLEFKQSDAYKKMITNKGAKNGCLRSKKGNREQL
jgi:hypothetical protein